MTATIGRMTVSDITQKITQIRREKKTLYTNYYGQCNDLPADTVLDAAAGDRSVVFFYFDDCVERVFFSSSDAAELQAMLTASDRDCVADIIGKDGDLYADVLTAAGFERYARYERYGVDLSDPDATAEARRYEDSARQYGTLDEEHVEQATPADAEEIDKRLREIFDPYEEHFYPVERLIRLIRNGWVWIARRDGRITTAFVAEIQGRKSYGNFVYNDGSPDDLYSVTRTAMNRIAADGVTYHYCWMNVMNRRAIRYNMKFFGLRPEGVYDTIYREYGKENEHGKRTDQK